MGGTGGPSGGPQGLPDTRRVLREVGTQAAQRPVGEGGIDLQRGLLAAAGNNRGYDEPAGLPDMRRVARDPGTQAAQMAPDAGGFGSQQGALAAAAAMRGAVAQQYPVATPDWLSSGGAMPDDAYQQMMAMGSLSRAIPRGRG
jgi:hypothetical protein